MYRRFRFRYEPVKATQAAAAMVVGWSTGTCLPGSSASSPTSSVAGIGDAATCGIDVRKVELVLYLLDRESVLRNSFPVVGGDYVMTQHGPMLPRFRAELARKNGGCWWRHIAWAPGSNTRIVVVRPPGNHALSAGDIDVLGTLVERYRTWKPGSIASFCKRLPEHVNSVNERSRMVVLEAHEFLEFVGVSDRDAKRMAARTAAVRAEFGLRMNKRLCRRSRSEAVAERAKSIAFNGEDRNDALDMMYSSMTKVDISKIMGCTEETLRLWQKIASHGGAAAGFFAAAHTD